MQRKMQVSNQEIIRALINIGAVILGFLLGQISDWVKTKRVNSMKKRSVRKLISLEVTQNIDRVESYWEKVLGSHEIWVGENKEFMYIQLAEAAAKNPFPLLLKDSWNANLNEITSAYSEEELEKIWNFHSDLERLSSLYVFFCEAVDEKKDTNRFHNATHGAGFGMIMSGLGFADSVRDHAPEFKQVVERIIKFEIKV